VEELLPGGVELGLDGGVGLAALLEQIAVDTRCERAGHMRRGRLDRGRSRRSWCHSRRPARYGKNRKERKEDTIESWCSSRILHQNSASLRRQSAAPMRSASRSCSILSAPAIQASKAGCVQSRTPAGGAKRCSSAAHSCPRNAVETCAEPGSRSSS